MTFRCFKKFQQILTNIQNPVSGADSATFTKCGVNSLKAKGFVGARLAVFAKAARKNPPKYGP